MKFMIPMAVFKKFLVNSLLRVLKVSKGAKIWNRYNQVPHLTKLGTQ